ncbi:hypothetical protein H5410_062892 [Solanum commersonii]|uniref:Inosine/uridine-preferring nucleoside hydrolase domain-containing protein n=1 Tax=Solanum commersonii TaxID=4109 RepID=A0A9J5WE15_SOLCO|nr:hypothetical protein H5410_062892 [Solanum commersonii]
MTILMAFQTPEDGIIVLATIFGNITTKDATRNALLLCEAAGYLDVPVVEGSSEPLKATYFYLLQIQKKIDKSVSEFLVEKVSDPGEVSILALGPLTNLVLAVKRDSIFASNVKRVVVLGDSFFALGNVNPAAEANVGDFFPNGYANIDVVGINITTQVKLKDADLEKLKQSEGKHAKFVCDMCKFYRDWHLKSEYFWMTDNAS